MLFHTHGNYLRLTWNFQFLPLLLRYCHWNVMITLLPSKSHGIISELSCCLNNDIFKKLRRALRKCSDALYYSSQWHVDKWLVGSWGEAEQGSPYLSCLLITIGWIHPECQIKIPKNVELERDVICRVSRWSWAQHIDESSVPLSVFSQFLLVAFQLLFIYRILGHFSSHLWPYA